MKVCILNDLHNEFESIDMDRGLDFDVLVLAGDTDIGIRGAKWAIETFRKCPIIYIAGNHEYYGNKIPKINAMLNEMSDGTNLYFLVLLSQIKKLKKSLLTD